MLIGTSEPTHEVIQPGSDAAFPMLLGNDNQAHDGNAIFDDIFSGAYEDLPVANAYPKEV
jgi:hypothetical protein